MKDRDIGECMKKGDKVGIVCCSNGQSTAYKSRLKKLHETLIQMGLEPVWSEYIYEKDGVFCGTGKERADALTEFYKRSDIAEIFDISGGDIANEVLPYLDYDVIASSGKRFWGYSDLTTILNAIYVKTGQQGVLYQVRNLLYDHAECQMLRFRKLMSMQEDALFDFSYEFVQGTELSGTVVGGNIRCLLKLAGTEFWPDMVGKILLLEAYGGEVPQMVTYLNQLKLMGVFEKVSGILLGTFTKLEAGDGNVTMAELVTRYAGSMIPIAVTKEIGHGTDAKAIRIGADLTLKKA